MPRSTRNRVSFSSCDLDGRLPRADLADVDLLVVRSITRVDEVDEEALHRAPDRQRLGAVVLRFTYGRAPPMRRMNTHGKLPARSRSARSAFALRPRASAPRLPRTSHPGTQAASGNWSLSNRLRCR